jgi:hypothetical protein
MNPRNYTFDGSPQLPPGTHTPPVGELKGVTDAKGLVDIAETSLGVFEMVVRPVESGQPIVRKSTGERGYLLRAVTNKIRSVTEVGKVTITTEELIAVREDQGKLTLYNKWDTTNWQLEN